MLEDQNPTMSTEDIVALIKAVGRTPIERDTVYNTIKRILNFKAVDDWRIYAIFQLAAAYPLLSQNQIKLPY